MTEPGKILVVDDEPGVRALLRDCLEGDGYRVLEAASGRELREALARGGGIDLVTLDLNLGGEDGLALAREVRGHANVPIVMITGKADPIDRVVGLELGADDYITKPFHVREVLARVRAVLRRYRHAPGDGGTGRLAFDRWRLDLGARTLADASGTHKDLTTAEFNLLAALVQRPQRVLSRDNLMDLVKGHDWTPLDRSIDALVSRLRKKIEADPERPQIVKSVRGVGYVLAAEVRRG